MTSIQIQLRLSWRMNAICCDDLFEFLSIRDQYALSQTSKRMHRLTGLYLQENFKNIEFFCKHLNIYHYDENGTAKYSGWAQFIQNIK